MPSRDITDCVKALQIAWPKISSAYAAINPLYRLALITTYRSPSEQFELFKKGRKELPSGEWVVEDKSQVVTNVDGYKTLGAHNYFPARAIDVAVMSNETGKALWEEVHYHPLLEIASGVGLESGGTWKSLKDWPHLQVPNFKEYQES